MSFLKELFNSMARVIGRIIAYLIIGFLLFYFFNNRVEAKTWIQINDTNGNMVCGSDSDIKDCTYGELKNGSYTYKKLNDYLIILEDLETMKSNNTYEIELSWTLKTYALNNNETSWITRNNYYTFTSYTQMNLQGSNGQLVDDSTKAWSLVGWSLTGTAGTNSSFANLAYNYSNTFTPTTDTDRIVLRITKRSRWESIGTYKDFYGVSPEIEITNLTYTIRNISASNQDIITNANQNTQDIINNQNQNQNQTNQGLQDIEDAILDNSQPNVDNFNYTDSTGGLISTFLTMPITLLRVMNNVDSCRSISLGELFGVPLSLDCINPGVFLGETLWNIIDYFIVFTMIASISQLFIYVYEKFKNLDDFFNEFYTPQHMAPDEYIPKHGGGK